MHNSKSIWCIQTICTSNDCSPIRDFFLVRATCKIRSVSYGSKHTSQSLSDMSFWPYLHAQLENYKSYTDALRIERLLYCQRYLFSGLNLCARYDLWVINLNTHHCFFPIRRFVHTYTHNSNTTGHVWTFHISKDCSTIRDVYFLC